MLRVESLGSSSKKTSCGVPHTAQAPRGIHSGGQPGGITITYIKHAQGGAHNVRFDDDGILPLGEGLLDDARIQLVAPAQPAALAAAAPNAASNQAPVLGPMHLQPRSRDCL